LVIDSWLPVGHVLPDGVSLKLALHEGAEWQIFEAGSDGHALVLKETLAVRWIAAGLIDDGVLKRFDFGGAQFRSISSGRNHVLTPVAAGHSPSSKAEALAFADALRATRAIDSHTPLHDALYVERLSRLLPTYSISASASDDLVLGGWLTGGVPVSTQKFRRLRSLVGWMGEKHLREVVARAGLSLPADEEPVGATHSTPKTESAGTEGAQVGGFALPGRPALERFLNEHVVEIITHREQYRRLGVAFPAPIILHGPAGCGKTYAVERLVDFLGWPSFAIEASSVASPYIHETSRKVARVFDQAMQSAPSILVIDEMEAFLADRERGAGSSHHRVEEVAEFLRRIPEATKSDVLVIAMTNRIEMIDPAILRRGRFDHVIKVDMASQDEVEALLEKVLSELPHESTINVAALALRLCGRPLSDVTFVVREGARRAARAGKTAIDQASLHEALESSPARESTSPPPRRIGFR
jgi:hypothetical protein